MKMLYVFVFISSAVIACNTHNNIEIDDCSIDDIRFSKQSLSFGASGGTDSVTAEGKYAFFYIRFANRNDTIFIPTGCIFEEGDSCISYGASIAHGISDIDSAFSVTYKNVDSHGFQFQTKIDASWVNITRDSLLKSIFTIYPNKTGVNREMILNVRGRMCFKTNITIKQSAE